MADYAPNEFRGRYARPGELDTSMLETHSVQKRPEVPPNPHLKPHTPSTGTVESKAIPLRQSELNPNLKSPAPTTGIVEAKSILLSIRVPAEPRRKPDIAATGIVESK